ncbi:MAG: class I SAM-dependent methyltransferase [Deltaproteobacteria bacterium]|nr:class I SAM-dependent methyltransferase [Deltaproteobacteria bacterium]
MSDNYKDYFIKDGRHIGDYEAMYQNCSDPWHIEALGLRLDMAAALLLLDCYQENIGKVLDLGCGAGLFSLEMMKKLIPRRADMWFVLSDISPTALKLAEQRLRTQGRPQEEPDKDGILGFFKRKRPKAKDSPEFSSASPLLSSEVDFLPLDLRTLAQNNPFSGKDFDLIVLAQVLWGILENLESTLDELKKALRPGGALLMSQHFPGESQQYGRDIVKSPEDLKGYLKKAGFAELHSLETDRDINHHYGGLWRSN